MGQHFSHGVVFAEFSYIDQLVTRNYCADCGKTLCHKRRYFLAGDKNRLKLTFIQESRWASRDSTLASRNVLENDLICLACEMAYRNWSKPVAQASSNSMELNIAWSLTIHAWWAYGCRAAQLFNVLQELWNVLLVKHYFYLPKGAHCRSPQTWWLWVVAFPRKGKWF